MAVDISANPYMCALNLVIICVTMNPTACSQPLHRYISAQFTPYEHNSLTAWIPLDDVDEEVGTLEYVPNSHK